MKTKFSSVVTVKEKKVDDLQQSLFSLDVVMRRDANTLIQTQKKFNELLLPSHGAFSGVLAFEDIKKAFRIDIAFQQETMRIHAANRSKLVNELQLAHTELEKIRYLEQEEIRAIVKKRAKKEATELDEVGVMLFNNRRKGA